MNVRRVLVFAFACCLVDPCAAPAAEQPQSGRVLWYDKPAERWVEALPVGNGHLGAMVYGGATESRWQYNDNTLWTGSPHDYVHRGGAEYLTQLRQLLFDGKQREAEQVASEHFMSEPLRQQKYQPAGDLIVRFSSAGQMSNYRRWLDLNTATAVTTYEVDDATITQTTFASHPADVLVIRLATSRPGTLAFAAELTTPHKLPRAEPLDEATVQLASSISDGKSQNLPPIDDAMRVAICLAVSETDGTCRSDASHIRVEGATHAVLILSAATNFTSYRELGTDEVAKSRASLAAARTQSYTDLQRAHTADHQSLFQRVQLDLGPGSKAASLPTDQRIVAAQKSSDPALAALLFDYGRYLMIAASRPGGQPANLQGLWNDQINPAWDSKYTVNINTEMNYWLAETCALGECAEPLFSALRDLADSGKSTAREQYGAPGWVLHHNFDLWRGTAPINASDHGIWPTGGAWLCQHLWWHYLYTGDEEWLRATAYPVMRSSAEFFAHYLVADPRSAEGYLVSGPSNSPEQGGLVMGPAMDHQIIRHLLASTIEASEVLNVDAELRAKLRDIHARIAPNHIGKFGQLQEWLEDVDNPQNDHRHVSHLWAVYPGEEITPATPALFDAARVSLEHRGDGGTGWSRAWKIGLWARLRDGDHALRVLHGLLTLTDSTLSEYRGGGVYPNLFDAHPPFQIDGNYGATAAIAEMLLQSHCRDAQGQRLIELLPALPGEWAAGSISGLRARGGYEVSLAWDQGRLRKCSIKSLRGAPALIAYGDLRMPLAVAKGETLLLDAQLQRIPSSPANE